GMGETHVLSAIARSLQRRSPQSPVVFTTGPRLVRAVKHAQSSGRQAEIEAMIQGAQALMIDDVHLMEINEQNQATLVSVLSHCFTNSKAVVMTSVYPPAALKAMEDALKFQ